MAYQLAHSKLQVSASSNALPKGAAVIKITPLVNKKVVGPDIVCTYDPGLDTYSVLADIPNPITDSVRFTSSYGGTVTAPLNVLR